jgi:hypothetical protein
MVVQSKILEKQQEPFVVPGDQDVPAFFRRILEKLLRKSRTERYSSAKQVQLDIAELRQREGRELPSGKSYEVDLSETREDTEEVWPEAEEKEPTGADGKERAGEGVEEGGRLGAVMFGALAVLVVGGGVFGIWKSVGGGTNRGEEASVAEKLKATGAEEPKQEKNEVERTGRGAKREVKETAKQVAARLEGNGRSVAERVGREAPVKDEGPTGGKASAQGEPETEATESSQKRRRSKESSEGEEREHTPPVEKSKEKEGKEGASKKAAGVTESEEKKEKVEKEQEGGSNAKDKQESMKVWGVE